MDGAYGQAFDECGVSDVVRGFDLPVGTDRGRELGGVDFLGRETMWSLV